TIDSFESILPDLSLPEPSHETEHSSLDTTSPSASVSDPDPFSATPSHDPLDDLRQYSQSIQGTSQLVQVLVPYHLYLTGTFGPFERDKLLLFITENEIGLSSQDLDLQIRSGKVFFPRISEFAGIKLIQELRDSGLQFRFVASER